MSLFHSALSLLVLIGCGSSYTATNGGGGAGGAGGTTTVTTGTTQPPTQGAFRYATVFSSPTVEEIKDVATGDNGNVVAVGVFSESLDVGGTQPLQSAGETDAFIVMLDPMGDHIWSTSLGGTGDDDAVVVTKMPNGNFVVAGHYRSTGMKIGAKSLAPAQDGGLFITMIDPMGDHIWSKDYVASDAEMSVQSVAVSPRDSTIGIAARVSGGTFNLNGAQGTVKDGFIHYIDPMGDHLTGESLEKNVYHDLVFSADYQHPDDGVVYMVGHHLGSPPTTIYGLNRPGKTSDLQGPNIKGTMRAVAIDPLSNNVLSAGSADGETFLRSMGGSGTLKLGKTLALGLKGDDLQGGAEVTGLTFDPWGNALIAAAFDNNSTFAKEPLANKGKTDILIAKFTVENGEVKAGWSQSFGAEKNDIAHGLSVSSTGEVVFGGSFEGTIDLGNGDIKSDGVDAFIASYTP